MPKARQESRRSTGAQETYIRHSHPAVGAAEAAALAAVVDSGQLAQGPRVEAFEAEVAAVFTTERDTAPAHRAVAVSSGTAALYLALRALGVAAGDEVLLPGYACMSLVQAIRYVGGTPCFVDCDPATFNIDADDARSKLSARTAAVLVAHMFGRPAEVEPFLELGPPVIEDCAQTLGIAHRGRPVGARGRLAVCSFYATKLVAAAEGGMVLSEQDSLTSKVSQMRDCEDHNGNEHAFNFKMSDLHAAVGSVQLQRLPELLQRRAELAERYLDGLRMLSVDLPAKLGAGEHAWFRFVVSDPSESVDGLIGACERRGLACRRPVGRLPGEVVDRFSELPGCRESWNRACSIPLYPALSDEAAGEVVDRFSQALGDLHG